VDKDKESYQRGYSAGVGAKENLKAMIDDLSAWARRNYPASAHLDYSAEIETLDQQRLEAEPDYNKYAELKGMKELYLAERKGFIEGAGCGRSEMAFHFSWSWFVSRRLNTRYIGTGLPASNCTGVFFREGEEGPMAGRNNDDNKRPYYKFAPPTTGPDGVRRLINSGVSSAVLCDEEPEEIFPAQPWELMPGEYHKDVKKVVDFLQRYNEFWGPCNTVIVDENLNSVAIEKSNCRMGVRWPKKGASAVTACSYLIPGMKEFKWDRQYLSLKLRGWNEDSSDYVYWVGCDTRYQRLLELVEKLEEEGPTLWRLANIMTDHAVPFPDRICLAGERGHPKDIDVNWTLTSSSTVLEGPTRRSLYWHVEGDSAIYDLKPFLVLGEGVQMKPEWLEGVRLPPKESPGGRE